MLKLVEDFSRSISVFWVDDETALDDIDPLLLLDFKLEIPDVLVDYFLGDFDRIAVSVVLVESASVVQVFVQNDSRAPDIDLFVVLFPGLDFRRHEVGTSAVGPRLVFLEVGDPCHSEIDDTHSDLIHMLRNGLLVVYDDVRGLDVPMVDTASICSVYLCVGLVVFFPVLNFEVCFKVVTVKLIEVSMKAVKSFEHLLVDFIDDCLLLGSIIDPSQ